MTPTQIILEALDEIAAVRHSLGDVARMNDRDEEAASLHERAVAAESVAERIRAGAVRWTDGEVAEVMA
jgi:hypothetical protein